MAKILSILLLLYIIPLVSAELILSNNPADLEVKKDEKTTFSIEFTNTFDFKLLEFQYPNLTSFEFPEFELDPGETKNVEYFILRNEAGSFELESNINFKYLVELPEGIQNYSINVSDQGFDPDYLLIRQGDSVSWINIDTIMHTITSGSFDLEIQPNQTIERTFNDIEIIDYSDQTMFFAGQLEVINATSQEYVHNPDYDKIWRINLDVTLDPTGLEFTLEKVNFSMNSSDSIEAIIQIRNFGNETAEKINLTSDPNWLRFDENEFSIEAGETNYVTFYIEPAIFSTSETNKTYNVSLYIDGLNTEKYVKTIEVFVDYEDVFDQIGSDEGIVDLFERWCKSHPKSLFCDRSSQECPEPEIIYKDVEIPLNLSQKEFLQSLKRQQIMVDSNQRTLNELKKVLKILEDDIPKMKASINESVTLQENNEQTQKTRNNVFWISFFFFILIGCGFAIGFAIKRVRQGKKLITGGYEGRS